MNVVRRTPRAAGMAIDGPARDATPTGPRSGADDIGDPCSGAGAVVVARLVIVSDIRLLRDGLARIVAERTSHSVDTAVPGAALPSRLNTLAPDLMLIDAATIRRGVAAQVPTAVPTAKLVAFAIGDDEDEIVACAQAGATGFVSRDASIDDLVLAIESALCGQAWCSPRMAGLICSRLGAMAQTQAADQGSLTARERQVLDLIAGGLSNKEIAVRLSIELSTVKNHVHTLLEKLHVKHRWQASQVACRVPDRASNA